MKRLVILLVMAMVMLSLAACEAKDGFDNKHDIAVISREDGSGTRGAFTDLFKIKEKDASGKKIDMTTASADITQSTGVMMTQVAGNKYAIGYISLGSLNDTLKAVKVDGVDATVENIKNGSYKISRPFNIATKGEINAQTQDFINYILSAEGQKIVEEAGYISAENTGAFESTGAEGKITVTGSTSVAPVMEKLKEAYEKINTKVTVEVSQSGSTAGMTSAIDGIADIGMASREVKDSEIEQGLNPIVIALDGIAVVVSNDNPTDNVTADQVKQIYTGKMTKWNEIK